MCEISIWFTKAAGISQSETEPGAGRALKNLWSDLTQRGKKHEVVLRTIQSVLCAAAVSYTVRLHSKHLKELPLNRNTNCYHIYCRSLVCYILIGKEPFTSTAHN